MVHPDLSFLHTELRITYWTGTLFAFQEKKENTVLTFKMDSN